jgi:hypothetical protein
MQENIVEKFIILSLEPLLKIWDKFVNIVPNIFASLIIILIGFFVSRVIASLFEHSFKKFKFDTWTSKIGLNEVMIRIGLGKSPTLLLSSFLYWFVMIIFIVSAANVLGLDFISKILEIFILSFLPKVIMAIVIGFAGLLLARFLEDTVYNSAMANNLKGGKSFAKIIHFVILVFTGILAIEQLGLEMKIIRSSINILMGSIGLAFAIAVGLGAKDIARDVITSMFSEKKEEK